MRRMEGARAYSFRSRAVEFSPENVSSFLVLIPEGPLATLEILSRLSSSETRLGRAFEPSGLGLKNATNFQAILVIPAHRHHVKASVWNSFLGCESFNESRVHPFNR